MSALKSALSDTWRGLIARRLWPVAVLLVVAMAALPLVLLSSPEPPAPPQADAAGDSAGLAAQPLVQVASPEERERLRRVLGARRDPFKPTNQPRRRATSSDESSARTANDEPGPAATPGSSGGGSPAAGSPATGGAGSPGPAPTPQPADDAPSKPAREPGSITIRWGDSTADSLERMDIERLDAIPSLDEPALVYLGVTEDGRSAVFLLDAGLAVDGDGRCRPSTAECQTIELRVGETEFIELEEQEGGATVQYQLDLVRIHGRVGERARASRRDEAREARATRRALRVLGQDEPVYRYDAATGTLELAPEQP